MLDAARMQPCREPDQDRTGTSSPEAPQSLNADLLRETCSRRGWLLRSLGAKDMPTNGLFSSRPCKAVATLALQQKVPCKHASMHTQDQASCSHCASNQTYCSHPASFLPFKMPRELSALSTWPLRIIRPLIGPGMLICNTSKVGCKSQALTGRPLRC